MQRISGSTALANANGTGKTGFVDLDSSLGIVGTIVTAAWLNALQEELCNIVELFGGTLDGDDNSQAYQAIKEAILAAVGGITLPGAATETTAGLVTLASLAVAKAGTSTDHVVTPAGLTAVVDLLAPLASPALTGTPTAPTASAGTATTQLATTAFVSAAISALVNAAPAALDTLNELASALGDDANFAATVTTALAAKAPLASPALAGTPTAPTASAGTATTQIATTAFVGAAVSAACSPGYHQGLRIQVTSSTAITLTADALVLAGTGVAPKALASVGLAIAVGSTGAGGLDTGTIAASTWYAVWVISGTAGTAAMLSLSATAPTLPSGYSYKMRCGWVRTNSSGALLGTLQIGRRAQYVVGGANLTALPALFTGVQGSTTTPTWVALSLATVIPSTAPVALVGGWCSSNSGDIIMIAPSSSYGTYSSNANPPPWHIGNGSGGTYYMDTFNILLETAQVIYIACSASTGKMWALGWEDSI